MQVNLNNPGEQHFHYSPVLRETDYLGPSPLLSPDQLPLLHGDGQLESSHFGLELEVKQEQNNFIQAHIHDLSPPILPQGNEFMFDVHLKQQAYNFDSSQVMPRYEIKIEEDPSQKIVQVKAEAVIELKLPQGQTSSIKGMIEFLVQNSGIDQHLLFAHGKHFCRQNDFFWEIFKILVIKFKKLHKTKQEMTKYCMRKAFKFIADRMKRDRTHNRDVDTCMKQYFSKNQNGNTFSIPFKKNSVQKTMNGNFLKKVFGSPSFAQDYNRFLKQLKSLMAEDNDKKIIYLGEVLEKYVKDNDLKKVEGIKRLPWTRETLMQTERLAFSLIGYAECRGEKLKDQ